jgi:hypothetical protein
LCPYYSKRLLLSCRWIPSFTVSMPRSVWLRRPASQQWLTFKRSGVSDQVLVSLIPKIEMTSREHSCSTALLSALAVVVSAMGLALHMAHDCWCTNCLPSTNLPWFPTNNRDCPSFPTAAPDGGLAWGDVCWSDGWLLWRHWVRLLLSAVYPPVI